MSAAIEAKVKEYADLIQECLDGGLFGNGVNTDKVSKVKENIRNAFQVSEGPISLVYMGDEVTQKSYNAPLKSYMRFYIQYENTAKNETYDSGSISIPYTGASWQVIQSNLVKIYAASMANKEYKFETADSPDPLADKVTMWKNFSDQWIAFMNKLNANQKNIIFNMFYLQQSKVDDFLMTRAEKMREVQQVERDLGNLLRQELPADWSKEQVYKGKSNWHYPSISIFDENNKYWTYGTKDNSWVRYFKYDPKSGNCHFRLQTGEPRHAKQVWRYLPFTPYWKDLKDLVEKALAQKAAAQGTSNP